MSECKKHINMKFKIINFSVICLCETCFNEQNVDNSNYELSMYTKVFTK